MGDPAGIPQPSHLYWMPLSSVLIYLSFLVLGPTFRAAQVPFVLLSALLPVLSYWVAYGVSRQRRHAIVSGLLAILSGFYLLRWVTPDNFAPFAIAGGVCLWALGQGIEKQSWGWFALAGVGAGLGHLARADGMLLVAVAGLMVLWSAYRDRTQVRRLAGRLGWLLAGYSVVMGPWFVRNWVTIGQPLATGGTQTVWLTDYDDLFGYRSPLGVERYLAWGWGNIVASKLRALWLNLQTVLFVGWMIFLFPPGLAGAWRLRKRASFQGAWLYLMALYLAMSLVFTCAGWRGGMLHSLVALLPFLYAAAMEGLDAFCGWMARRRKSWRQREAQTVFSGAAVVFALALSLVLAIQVAPAARAEHPYRRVARWLDEQSDSQARVMINDPAMFYYYGRRSCVVIPNSGLDTVIEVMRRYDVQFLVLDENNPTLHDLYANPEREPRLRRVHTFQEPTPMHVFQLKESGE
jgi:4-amino-4-deoxy-L-arabinose transferase-like glycosyltransferase